MRLKLSAQFFATEPSIETRETRNRPDAQFPLLSAAPPLCLFAVAHPSLSSLPLSLSL